MNGTDDLADRIFNLQGDQGFNELALEIFRYQFRENKVYGSFARYFTDSPDDIRHYSEIPYLPAVFFRDQVVMAGNDEPEHRFTSSGTTGSLPAVHPVRDLSLYRRSFTTAFRHFYGDPSGWIILALLPSYLERSGSSLVYMAGHLIRLTGHPLSGFHPDDPALLKKSLIEASGSGRKVLLLGVSFALLRLAETYPVSLPGLVVMETGGMKGRGPEITREELHERLTRAFHTETIHSEYGMTELLSQAYSYGHGLFRSPPWMKVIIRDSEDPLTFVPDGNPGGVNIIDLANLHSCSFIATQDLGKTHPDGGFEISGRFDSSDIRGCNLLMP